MTDNRCYFRGCSWLGIFNTITGCIFNRVLVKVVDTETRKVIRYYWDYGTKHKKKIQ